MDRALGMRFLRVVLLSTGLLACGKARNTGDTTDTITSAIDMNCGVKPRPPACMTVVCDPDQHVWEYYPVSAGTPCPNGGTCDDDGNCIVPPPPPPPTPRVLDFTGLPGAEFPVVPDAAIQTFEVKACTFGADPVLHFFRLESGRWVEHGADDNSGGGVTPRLAVLAGDSGLLLARAKDDQTGTCDVYRNGVAWQTHIAIGGKTINAIKRTWHDAIETVSMPRGNPSQAIYRLIGISIVERCEPGTGTASSARCNFDGNAGSFLVQSNGPSRVIINDEASDSDGDGLGDLLEAELGTCSNLNSTVAGFDCSKAKTPKDTDGDGISDGWEVLGKRDLWPPQTFALWGANPRHKDLFVELDYRSPDGVARHMPPEEVRRAAAVWQDTAFTLSAQQRFDHAFYVGNPDGQPGVSLHVDTGQNPQDPVPDSDFTLYGDWGGYSVTPSNTDYTSAWTTYLTPARRGSFHWVLGSSDGGGQTSGFASTAYISNGVTMAHELGHTVGLQHYGAASAGVLNCKPVYASIMNYAYNYVDGVGFSDGVAPVMNNNALKEYGALGGLQNPNFYADLYQRAFGYFVDRSTWSVDWDRDGVIAPYSATVRAGASDNGAGCENVRERRTGLPSGSGGTAYAPAVARTAGKVVVFAATAAGVDAFMSDDTYFNCVAAGGPNFDHPCGTFYSPGTFSVGSRVVGVAAAAVDSGTTHGIAVAAVTASGDLYRGWVTVASLPPFPPVLVGGFESVPAYHGVIGEPAMASDWNGTAKLVFKGADGALQSSLWIAGGGWVPLFTETGPNGPIHVSDAPGIVWGRLPGDTTSAWYIHARHDAALFWQSSFLRMSDGGIWTATPFATATSNNTRPALAYVPNSMDPSRGTMYAAFPRESDGAFVIAMSGVSINTNTNPPITTPTFGPYRYFDNGWATGHGIGLMYQPGSDTNLRAAVVYNFGDWNQRVVFQPLADGIVDLNYSAFNDWATIGHNACSAVANPGGLVSNPMPCF